MFAEQAQQPDRVRQIAGFVPLAGDDPEDRQILSAMQRRHAVAFCKPWWSR
jgi:hypothetical protein